MGSAMRDSIRDAIVQKLNGQKETLRAQFKNRSILPTRYFVVDDLLPAEITKSIFEKFPEVEKMRLMSSFREKKYTSKNLDQFDQILSDITFAFQDPAIIACVEEITGMKGQIPDPKLYAGGLSIMGKGHFLHPHIDNSHEGSRTYYRSFNLLFYATPGWQEEFGGNLELWDLKVRQRVTIASLFNRLVVMETSKDSWHSVSEVKVDRWRSCVSNYYFSKNSPLEKEYYHVTSFSAPPEKPFVRVLSRLDGALRNSIRKVYKPGLGKTDIYQPSNPV